MIYNYKNSPKRVIVVGSSIMIKHSSSNLKKCHRLTFTLFLILFNVWTTQGVFGQSVNFYHIAPSEKFGFGNVWATVEDYEGFIWLGTEDGLYRYDGYNILTFQHNKSDSTSIGGNFIISLFEDSRHNLWIGTYGNGLSLYNKDRNTFSNFKNNPANPNSLPNDRVKTIIETKDGTIWVGTEGGGVATFKPDEKEISNIKFKNIKHDPNDINSLSSDFIRSIVLDKKNDNIYIGTYGGGINVTNQQTTHFKHIRTDAKNPDTLSSDQIIKLFVDSKNRLWVGSIDAGVDLYLVNENKFIHYAASNSTTTLNDNEIESIAEDKNGVIWVGTDNGLSMMVDSKSNVPKNLFENFRHEPLDEYSLLSNSVKIVYVDSRNSVWAGTYFGGINIYNSNSFKFHPIRIKPWLNNSLNDNNITAFAEDKNGNLWIGTDAGGLNCLPHAFNDIYSDQYKHIKIKNPITGKIETKIKSLAVDQKGYVWVGLWGEGVYRFDPKNESLKYYGPNYSKSAKFDGYNVLQIKVDQKNNLWMGTFAKGVFYFDQSKNTFTNYLPYRNKENALTSERIRALLIDSKQRVWIGGDVGGLNLFNTKTKAFERIEYGDVLTKNSTILNLLESHDGKIWIGTVSSGAIVYDPESKKAWSYTKENGLFDDVVSAMLEDSSKRIWLSTTKGLTVFDPKHKTTKNYNKDDGLQGNHFNSGSALKCANGMLLFGGTNGWNAFRTESITTNHTSPKIAFVNFWLNNTQMDVNSPDSPLTSSLNSTHSIELRHDQNSFSLEFAALEFNSAKNNKYAYWLEGFDSDWQYSSTDRKATFTNLFPGRYKLRVKATNQDGIWSERDQPLLINIYPAWWQSAWFKVAAVFLILLLIYLTFRLRVNYLLNQRKKLTHEVQLRTSELKSTNLELAELYGEVQSQNEELISQNEQINTQREELQKTQKKLEITNEKLEQLVKQRTLKLETTIKELDKTVFELDRFVYSASHDLSSPLKSILGLVHIARMEVNPQMLAQYYDYVEESILKLERVIKNLVEYSRNSHMEIQANAFHFSNLVNDVIQELAFWPEAQKITITNISDPNIEIISDEQRIKVILHNLISNGIKYADFGKPSSYIKIDCTRNGSNCVIQISDNGIGIDEKEQNRVFEMYYRATDRSQGSGLGLFIVKEIINKLEGGVTIKSSAGNGTDFYVELPMLFALKPENQNPRY